MYGHILRMNEEKISNRVLNMKVKASAQDRDQGQNGQQVRKDVTQKGEKTWEEIEEEELSEDRSRWRGFIVRRPA
jgi:hypothetical protein